MIIRRKQEPQMHKPPWHDLGSILTITAALCLLLAVAACNSNGIALLQGQSSASNKFCSATADAQFEACQSEVSDDHFQAQAVCTNISAQMERDECLSEAGTERDEGADMCGEQRTARKELCGKLGEARYDPDFDPANFDSDFANLTSPNPYFPLAIGNQWLYQGGDEETVTVNVLGKTKLIEGVTCIVVNDREEQEGELVEDTDDWFGQRKNGTVDYCGEISKNFEQFDGDDPQEPELVDIDGSWKAGRDGAKPGTLFPGAPAVGMVYRQEWAPGDAEDAATVLSTSYGFGSDPELDEFVPQALATLLCQGGDCVVTGEFTPVEPGGFERKYYAAGIGLFLEVDAEDGDIVQLVDCNFDPRCLALPPS